MSTCLLAYGAPTVVGWVHVGWGSRGTCCIETCELTCFSHACFRYVFSVFSAPLNTPVSGVQVTVPRSSPVSLSDGVQMGVVPVSACCLLIGCEAPTSLSTWSVSPQVWSTFLKQEYTMQTALRGMENLWICSLVATAVWRSFMMIPKVTMATVIACSPGCMPIASCSTQTP